MGKTAFLFPGQASQYPGMGKEVHSLYPEAAEVFRKADEALGFPISRMCFTGTEEELKLTANTQPAILTVSVAVLRVVARLGLRPDFVAGHSLGEYSALVAASSLSFEDAVVVVHKRGQYMQEAVPVGVGAMAAVMGAELDAVADVCESARGEQILSPANINCPGQIVIAGHKEAVDRAVTQVRAVMLPVSAPFHCALMQPAQDKLAADLRQVRFSSLQIPLVTNVDARVIRTGDEARDSLIRQVTGAVLWQKSMELLLAEGVDIFVEIGPKSVLSGMLKKINRQVRVLAVEKAKEIEEAVKAIKR